MTSRFSSMASRFTLKSSTKPAPAATTTTTTAAASSGGGGKPLPSVEEVAAFARKCLVIPAGSDPKAAALAHLGVAGLTKGSSVVLGTEALPGAVVFRCTKGLAKANLRNAR